MLFETLKYNYNIPFSTEMPCSAPANISDGYVTVSSSPLLDDNATYQCHPGFDLIGYAVSTCVALGPGVVNWQPAAPTCNSKL